MSYILMIWITIISPSGIDVRVVQVAHSSVESCEDARRMITASRIDSSIASTRIETYCVQR